MLEVRERLCWLLQLPRLTVSDPRLGMAVEPREEVSNKAVNEIESVNPVEPSESRKEAERVEKKSRMRCRSSACRRPILRAGGFV